MASWYTVMPGGIVLATSSAFIECYMTIGPLSAHFMKWKPTDIHDLAIQRPNGCFKTGAEPPRCEYLVFRLAILHNSRLVVSTLAMSDALAKLCMAKGLFTDEEFKAQLGAERANYLAVLKRLH